jgi:hypothetical protein
VDIESLARREERDVNGFWILDCGLRIGSGRGIVDPGAVRDRAKTHGRAARRIQPRKIQDRKAFTLLETALAIVIISTGVLAMMAAQTAFHQKNGWSSQVSIGMRLGNEIREMTLKLPRRDPVTGAATWGPESNELSFDDYDDLDDFDGAGGTGLIFSADLGNGPVNARREIIPDMAGWSQTVTIVNVDPFDINSVVDDGASEMVKVIVVIEYQGPTDDAPQEVTRVSWIAPN